MKTRLLPLLALMASVSALAFNPVFDQAVNQFRDETVEFKQTLKQNRRASQSMRQAYKASKKLAQSAQTVCDDLMTMEWDNNQIDADLEQLRGAYGNQQNAMDQVTVGMTFPVAMQFAQVGQDLTEVENQWEDCRDEEDEDFGDDMFQDAPCTDDMRDDECDASQDDMDQDDMDQDDMDQDDMDQDDMDQDDVEDEPAQRPATPKKPAPTQNPWDDVDYWDQW